jgi:SAM-dependent MidA family methyltransferase
VPLPPPDIDASRHSETLGRRIAEEIRAGGGWVSFARYMELALYAPGLGYYSAGARKFGAAGDFVTAPETSPLFAATLAVQVEQVMACSAPRVVEAGPGSGALAAGLLLELDRRGALPERYELLEVSPELRQRQAETLCSRVPHLASRVSWLDELPRRFAGAVIANELLDALPVHVAAWTEDGILERGVALAQDGSLRWAEQPASGTLLATARCLPVEAPYVSEIGLAARAWIGTWAASVEAGALLLIDYGFPRREYYHPQRSAGTLMCHYRHHAHGDPFHLPGLNDITAHVDFTAIAEAGVDRGLELYGYTSQAQFLLNCGITGLLARTPPERSADYLRLAAGAQRLLSPSEMGELFKVMAMGRGIAVPLIGFASGDRSHRL